MLFGAAQQSLDEIRTQQTFQFSLISWLQPILRYPTLAPTSKVMPESKDFAAADAIRDRLKDVIISGGENISSIEVEGVLLRHPAVQEVALVGLPHEKWGEAPHAFVVLRSGASTDEGELVKFARDRLAHFKAPHGVTFLSELPKTATGKIQKYVLRGRPTIVKQ